VVAEEELKLVGGRQSFGIVRIGNTVRRPLHRNSEFVHALLRQFDALGFDGAPRLLGIDDQGREILSFIEGEVFVGPEEVGAPVTILNDAQLASAGRLIRRFHDATAGTPLAGDAEVVCHPDLGQHNIVFRGDEAVAIIDWSDDVAPGPRIRDFAHAVWFLAEVGAQGGAVEEQARRVRILCDAYGWDDSAAVIDEIEARFRRARASHERNGRLEGARIFSELIAWIVEHGPALKSHL
jgi:Ser/Thr protein kinase RdoA (MazF antagonist)